jgi:hypothetical protein
MKPQAKPNQEAEATGPGSYPKDPWIPAGFEKYNDRVAIKWRTGRINCRIGDECRQIEIIAKNGCKNLYVEAAKMDARGNNIGMTNDSTVGLKPRQKAVLEFSSNDKLEITEVSCR